VAAASTGFCSGGDGGCSDDVGGAAGFTGVGGCDKVGGVDRVGVLGGIGSGGDSGGATGLRMGPSALEFLITANDDRYEQCGGATETPPTFTLMEGMEGAKDIAASLELCKSRPAGSFVSWEREGEEGGNAWRRPGHTPTLSLWIRVCGAKFPSANTLTVCEVCRDSTWAQCIQTFS
jgi:hypothetical protein